jgi:hypothetical protein
VKSINKLVTGELGTLSEEELVECDTNGQSNGCMGLTDDAFEFIIKNSGTSLEDRCDINTRNAIMRRLVALKMSQKMMKNRF